MTHPPPGFGVLILTHGRPANVRTLRTLQKHGYTGPWWLVCDDDDPALAGYQQVYGQDRVRVFTKDDTAQDMADNGGPRSVVVYARNAAQVIARDLNLTHVMQLDDDYTSFRHRYVNLPNPTLTHAPVRDFDAVCDALVAFLEETGALTVALAQGGDLLGGAPRAPWRNRVLRKAMNSFVTRVDRPVTFVGRVNEDVNTYVTLGSRGAVFLSPVDVILDQLTTQTNPGGMTSTYLDDGTYRKSFYTVMMNPSCVRVRSIPTPIEGSQRLHHAIRWNRAVPMILSDRWRRE